MSVVVLSEAVTAVVGAPTDHQYTIAQWMDEWDLNMLLDLDAGMIATPLTLFPAQVEGVDYPFFSREDPTQPIELWDAPLAPFFEGSIFEFNIPLAELPPDTTPLFMLEADHTSETAVVAFDLVGMEYIRGIANEDQSISPLLSGQLSYSDNMCRVLDEIQRHMLEPIIDEGLSWQLWSESEVRGSIEERLCRFLLESGITRQRISVSVGVGERRPNIPEEIIEIRRVQWLDATGRSLLTPVDINQMDNAFPGWQTQTAGTPQFYIEEPVPTLTVELSPVPALAGTLEMVVVLRPTSLAGCAAFPIPATFVPYIKYGVMADMLMKEGEANDPERAKYCDKRFDEGIDLARALIGATL